MGKNLVGNHIRNGGHPLLGYNSNLCDELYKKEPEGKTRLIQIPIGPYRQRPWLMGGLSR